VNYPDDYINKIICGDCLEVMKDIPDKSINLVIADPPYYKIMKNDWDNQWKIKKEYLFWCTHWIKECKRVLKNLGSLYVWCNAITKKSDIILDIYQILKKYLIFQSWIVWRRQFTHGNSLWLQVQEVCLFFSNSNQFVKNSFRVDSDKFEKVSNRCSNVWYIKDVTKQGYYVNKESVGHPSQKPVEAIERLIKGSSNKDDIILDPFLGSGTTAVACKELGRKFIGIEINPEYCKIAEKRLKNTMETFL